MHPLHHAHDHGHDHGHARPHRLEERHRADPPRRRPLRLDDRADRDVWRCRLDTYRRGDHLTAQGVEVLRKLLRFRSRRGRCYPSYETLAAAAGCCERAARAAVGEGRRLGILDWVQRRTTVPWPGRGTSRRSKPTSNSYSFYLPDALPPPKPSRRRVRSTAPSDGTKCRQTSLEFDSKEKHASTDAENVARQLVALGFPADWRRGDPVPTAVVGEAEARRARLHAAPPPPTPPSPDMPHAARTGGPQPAATPPATPSARTHVNGSGEAQDGRAADPSADLPPGDAPATAGTSGASDPGLGGGTAGDARGDAGGDDVPPVTGTNSRFQRRRWPNPSFSEQYQRLSAGGDTVTGVRPPTRPSAGRPEPPGPDAPGLGHGGGRASDPSRGCRGRGRRRPTSRC